MDRKRSKSTDRDRILKKIRKLEKKILSLPDSDSEENTTVPETKENATPPVLHQGDDEEVLFQGFLEEENPKLEEEVLNILGVTPDSGPKKETLRPEIAQMWIQILEKGLKKEEKEELTKNNLPFENCPKMVAPKLNKEVRAALNENGRKRDALIELRQKQISTTLSCLGQAMQLCLGKNIQENRLDIIKKVSEASKLLCDTLFLDSRGRRSLVLSTINKNLKDSLLETVPEEFLFGSDLGEKIKTAKAVQKSGKDLKTTSTEDKKTRKPDTVEKKKALNWRGPPRTTQIKKTGGLATYNQPPKVDNRKFPKK